MNKKNLNKVAVFFWLLMLTISLAGCNKKPASDKEVTQPQNVVDGTKDGKIAEDIVKEDNNWPKDSVTFSTTNGYTTYLKLQLELPEGLVASDLTKLAFSLDTEEPLELRLYAGANQILMNAGYELTGETVEPEAVSDGTEQVEVDGKSIEQENYTLKLNKKDVTRFYLSEGAGHNVEFNVDERAAEVLTSIEGDRLLIGISANNLAPEFTIYKVTYTVNGTEYSVTLDENSAKPARGSYLQFH